MIIKKILRGTFLLFSFLLALCSSASNNHSVQNNPNLKKTFLIKGDRAYPPFEFINENGEPDGFDVDLIKAIMEEQGLRYILKLEKWNAVVEQLKAEKIDAVAGMAYSDDRTSFAKFGMPHNFIFQNIIFRKEQNVDSLEQLRGKQIIVQNRAQAHELLLNTKLTNKIDKVVEVEQGLIKLSKGEGDALVCNNLIALYYIQKDDLSNLGMTAIRMEPLRYSMAVSKNNDELLHQFNLGLYKLKQNGTYDKIYHKWFGAHKEADYKQIFLFLLLLLFVVVILLAFLVVLRRQVRKATQKLKESYREIELAIDGGGLAIWMYNFATDRFSRLHGQILFSKECSFEEYKALFHSEDVPIVEQSFFNLKSGKIPKDSNVFRCTKQMGHRSLYIEYTVVAVKEEGVVTHLIGTHKDVTVCNLTKKRLEDSLLKTDFMLEVSQMTQWDYLVETQTFHSRRSNGFFNIPFPMHLEKLWPILHPDDLEVVRSLAAKMNAGVDEMQSLEFRAKSGVDVSYRWVIINVAPFQRNEKGQILSYAGLSRDNTKWHAMMDDLNALREKAEESNRLKSAFLANMSHEIRTPLNAIVGFSSLISSAETEEECKLFEENINCNAELLLSLVSDILDISKIESGNMHFHYASFDLCEMCRSVYYQFSLRMKEDVELRYSPVVESFEVNSDMSRLMQVLTNFVGNAVKFTEKGFIEIGFTPLDTQVEVWVKDSGTGIPADKLELIFHRFAKLNDFVQGTGLGLSISQDIVKHLGGTIGADSEMGEGSRFWFRIPLVYSNKNEGDNPEYFL